MKFATWLNGSNWTQARFARAIGAPRQTVQAWVSGKRTPTLYYALAICALSEGEVVPADWLTDKQHLMLRGIMR